ncbi:MAG: hypothetical protein V4578_24200 [Pseudomonadota bacterium]
MFCGAGMTFEVQLVLRAADVRPLQLPKDDGARRARLGIDAFLFQGGAARPHATTCDPEHHTNHNRRLHAT